MNWICKSMVFKALGVLPWCESIYYFMQRNVTHNLIVNRDMVLSKLQTAIEYLKFVEKALNIKDFNDTIHFDIGAGWMPTIPLLFYSVGFERQILCDIHHKLHHNIVSDVISIFQKVVLQERNLGSHCKRLPPLMDPGDTLESYLKSIGISYIAPYSNIDLLKDNGFKLFTCTQVLYYLNETQLSSLFQTIASALKNGGVLLAYIDLHYNNFGVQKWRYSDFVWDKLINSKMITINRLTASGYQKLLQESGLEIIAFHASEPTASDLEELRYSKVHKQFRHIPERELAAQHLFFAAKRGGSDINFLEHRD